MTKELRDKARALGLDRLSDLRPGQAHYFRGIPPKPDAPSDRGMKMKYSNLLPRLGPPVSPEVREVIAEHRRQQPRSPCHEQTPEDIESYYRHKPEGSSAAVRHTQHGRLCYEIAEIEDRKPRAGRIYITRGHGAFYMKSGKNCFHPTGQTWLVVPTEAVIAWANEHPWGESGYAVYYPAWG